MAKQIGMDLGTSSTLIFLKEKADSVEIGFRSKHHSGIDVGVLASTFGGGGHMHAAGATVQMSAAEARKVLLERFSSML